MNGGKLCEAAFSIVDGYLSGSYPNRASKPSNMLSACAGLERSHTAAIRSMRIQIPRMIVALYEIRNNRGVGHAGGDVDPNEMDATVVLYMSKWIVAELVRVLHNVDTSTASELVERLVERQIPLVWQAGDMRRVLQSGLTQRKQTLLLLLGQNLVKEDELLMWLEKTNAGTYRRDVLRPMHRGRELEYDEAARTIRLLPPGVLAAEAVAREESHN